ncbi:MAG TPA: NDP-hexose 2,3-dehydratase family protein, partial [Micromonosporaceae bacterium]|nr:NDP-hexose 2,3-dehydratase family protein [Micromonosporaceae bacterium]
MTTHPELLADHDSGTPGRIARSMRPAGPWPAELAAFRRWFTECQRHSHAEVRRIGLDGLRDWHIDPDTGNIRHRSGRFFTIAGLSVEIPDGPVPRWEQPIILQPEIGILGIIVTELDGVLHCLMQAKIEPGNANGLQLSPTVQATRSNYTRVHGGRAVPYLEYFVDTGRSTVLADVRQSEQGSWFHRKRNRNMVVEIRDRIEVLDGFRWMTLGEVHRLLAVDDVVNMDARTVLSCLPFPGTDLAAVYRPAGDRLRAALVRSCAADAPGLHPMGEILSWITDLRTRTEISTTIVPLGAIRGWHRDPARIRHDSGLFFDVVGVEVAAGGREVARWSQPMFAPHGTGVVAFLVQDIGGVLHILVRARVEPGFVDVIELAPTVQCTPQNYVCLPPAARPPYLDEVLGAGPGRTRFASVLSEEGGRFHHARNSYRIVETDIDPRTVPGDFRWLTVRQLSELLRHSHYVNIQARTMIACLHAMVAGLPDTR